VDVTEPVAPGVATTSAVRRHGRLVGPDVTRGVALIGVVVMNYHGYLNGVGAAPDDAWYQSMFDPWKGALSTRFAATFVTVAGVGITLLTRRSVASGDHAAISDDRWRLTRRGVLLYLVGLVLNWVWGGTILFFYGAFFVLGALLFTLRSRVVLIIGAVAALSAAGIRWWAETRIQDGHSVAWLLSPSTFATRSPRGLLFDTFINGTHPVLPWLSFLCAGIVLGRHLAQLPRLALIAGGAALTALTYAISHLVRSGSDDPVTQIVFSTRYTDRGLLYTFGTLGTSVVAFCVLSWLGERFARAAVVSALACAGRTTLSIYLLHVFVFRAVVNWWGLVQPTGLDTALMFALAFWVFAIIVATWWQGLFGAGPIERIYRRFGG
jgi:uncharacterized protein